MKSKFASVTLRSFCQKIDFSFFRRPWVFWNQEKSAYISRGHTTLPSNIFAYTLPNNICLTLPCHDMNEAPHFIQLLTLTSELNIDSVRIDRNIVHLCWLQNQRYGTTGDTMVPTDQCVHWKPSGAAAPKKGHFHNRYYYWFLPFLLL